MELHEAGTGKVTKRRGPFGHNLRDDMKTTLLRFLIHGRDLMGSPGEIVRTRRCLYCEKGEHGGGVHHIPFPSDDDLALEACQLFVRCGLMIRREDSDDKAWWRFEIISY